MYLSYHRGRSVKQLIPWSRLPVPCVLLATLIILGAVWVRSIWVQDRFDCSNRLASDVVVDWSIQIESGGVTVSRTTNTSKDKQFLLFKSALTHWRHSELDATEYPEPNRFGFGKSSEAMTWPDETLASTAMVFPVWILMLPLFLVFILSAYRTLSLAIAKSRQ